MSEVPVLRVEAEVWQYDSAKAEWFQSQGSGPSVVHLYRSLARIIMNIFNFLKYFIYNNLVYEFGVLLRFTHQSMTLGLGFRHIRVYQLTFKYIHNYKFVSE